MNIANRVLDELYFITTTVVDWVDIFTRPKYKHIILESLAYCQQQKGLKIYAWVVKEQPPAHDCQCRCRADGGRHHARLQEVHRQADINKVGLNK